MIPKLYESNETSFKTNGLGSLSDALSCVVTEERNGAYELEMEYPVGGLHYDLIETNRIIYAKPNETSEPQPFDIKEVTLSMDGMKATIYAQHIRYRLNGIPVKPFKAIGITNALQGLVDNAMINQGFTVWTDINNGTSVFNLEEPNTFGQVLGGTDGSILDVFSGSSGCEYEFDKKNIKLWAHRGSDNGVSIRYGKNLKGCKMETNIESVYTGVLAYWLKEDEGNQTLVQGDIQYIDNHASYPRENIYLLDCSSDYSDVPSKSDLNTVAKAYAINNKIGEPSVSADIEFYQLWQTEEYKDVAPLERVSLCDTVNVIFRELGCDVEAIVNKTVYDVLLERYNSVSIGSAKSKLGDTVKQTAKEIIDEQRLPTDSWVQGQIDKTVEKIRGGTNGHVVLTVNANGETNELYAYDGDSLASANKVLRLNYQGIAGSSNGVNGKYSLAISTDGTINANMITTGTLKAINIEGVTIKGATISGTVINFGNPVVMTLKSDSDGALFEGTGWFKANAVGGFKLLNYFDSSKQNIRNSIYTANDATDGNALNITNYFDENHSKTNQILLSSLNSYASLTLGNAVGGMFRNFIQCRYTSDSLMYIGLYNQDSSSNDINQIALYKFENSSNQILLTNFGSNNNLNRIALYNDATDNSKMYLSFGNGYESNNVYYYTNYLHAQMQSDTYNAIYLYNKSKIRTTYSNYMGLYENGDVKVVNFCNLNSDGKTTNSFQMYNNGSKNYNELRNLQYGTTNLSTNIYQYYNSSSDYGLQITAYDTSGNLGMWFRVKEKQILLKYASWEDRFELNNESAIMRHSSNWIEVSNSNAIRMYADSKLHLWTSNGAIYATNGHYTDSGSLFSGRVPIVTGSDGTHAVELYWTGSKMQVYVDGTHQYFE